MDTPPDTPPPSGQTPIESLAIRYWDFAYEEKGPFRMPTINIAETTAKTYGELLSGPVMEIYVGRKKRQWSLHRNLLSYHTAWFRQQIKEEVREKGGKVEMFDDDPAAFELLVKWLYQGAIDDVSTMAVDKKWDYAFACQKLYILCEKINLPQLKNLAMDQFRRGCYEARLVPGVEEMVPVYQRTPMSSPFRKLMSNIAARQIMDPDNENDSSAYRAAFATSPDFAIDVINAIKDGAGGTLFRDPTERGGCQYHDHPLGQYCPSSSKKRPKPPEPVN